MKILLAVVAVSIIVFIALMSAYSNRHDEPVIKGIAEIGNSSPEEFFQNGGRSYISATAETSEINATIGSTVQVTLTLKHETSANPVPIATVHYTGVQCCLIINGHGDIDWNSTVIPSTSQISLLAGESKKVVLLVSIPKDLPRSFVNETIPYNIGFGLPNDSNPREIVSSIASFRIHIVA